MEKDKDEFISNIVELGRISEIIENNLLFSDDVDIVIRHSPEKYYDILHNFKEIKDKTTDSFIVSISGLNFKFVLQK